MIISKDGERMARIVVLFLALWVLPMAFTAPALANNLNISNVRLVNQDTVNNTWDVQFDISWDNSWYDTGAPSLTANWDAAWIFVKFSKATAGVWGDWTQTSLLNTGSVAASGAQITFGQTGAVYKGIFIYRDAAGSGSVSWSGNKIRWNYGADGVADNDEVQVRVFGIEMVYIPTGTFYAGDYATSAGSFKRGSADTDPWVISSENTINVTGAVSGGYYFVSTGGSYDNATGSSFTIPLAYPKGYQAFYIMKYEVSQGQYRDFLNTLTRTQQNNRTQARTANVYVMTNTANVNYRSGIRAPSSIPSGVITFGCDLEAITANNTTAGDGTFNESNDGEWLAANYLNWPDGAAYADWACLRPMSELEFEKAARGGQAATAGEYAWGNTTLEAATTSLTNSGQASEVVNQGNMNYTTSSPDGPYRVGVFSDAGASRQNAGASYFGVMDLSGSVWEPEPTVGSQYGRPFAGTHGDGVLTSDGFADNSDWPYNTSGKVDSYPGMGVRGGSWYDAATYARTSDRSYAGAGIDTSRRLNTGFRGVRTAP